MSEVWEFILVFSGLIILSLPFIGSYLKTRREVALFSLYKIRDEWVYLVAAKKLSKDDEIFKKVYRAINRQLELAECLTLDRFFEEMERQNFVDKQNSAEFTAFSKKVHEMPEDAQKVLKDYYKASLFVMYENSNVLKVFLVAAKHGLIRKYGGDSRACSDAQTKTQPVPLLSKASGGICQDFFKQVAQYKTVEKSGEKIFGQLPAYANT